MTLVDVEHVKQYFPIKSGVLIDRTIGHVHAVDDVTFALRPGETLSLVGESGCGKTTSVLAVLRLLPPGGRVVGGSVEFDGEDLLSLPPRELRAFRWTRLSLVFQGAMNALNPVRPVGDQVAEAVRLHFPERGAATARPRPRRRGLTSLFTTGRDREGRAVVASR